MVLAIIIGRKNTFSLFASFRVKVEVLTIDFLKACDTSTVSTIIEPSLIILAHTEAVNPHIPSITVKIVNLAINCGFLALDLLTVLSKVELLTIDRLATSHIVSIIIKIIPITLAVIHKGIAISRLAGC